MGGEPSSLGLYNNMVTHAAMMQDADFRNMDMTYVIIIYQNRQKRIFTGLSINYVNI